MNLAQYNRGMCPNQCIMIYDVQRNTYGTFRVGDACYACGWGNIDFTQGALSVFGRNQYDGSSGMFPIRWRFC